VRADDPVKRRRHIGVAVIDGRNLGVDLSLLQIGLRVITRGCGLFQRCLRDDLSGDQVRLTFEIGFCLLQRGLRTGFGGLRLLKFQFVGFRLDREQGCTLFYERAVFVADCLKDTLYARHQID